MRRVLGVVLVVCLAVPAYALVEDFANNNLDLSVWNTRLPQPGAKVLSGRSSSAAEDGLEGRLTLPEEPPGLGVGSPVRDPDPV